jgi:hypothetical protein
MSTPINSQVPSPVSNQPLASGTVFITTANELEYQAEALNVSAFLAAMQTAIAISASWAAFQTAMASLPATP